MGMFDEILVPKSYLKGLLKKEDEKLFKKNHLFQTKDLENVMDLYKVHRQRLYKLENSRLLNKSENGSNEKWKLIKQDLDINFYDFICPEEGDRYSAEFEFSFIRGKLDKKKLIHVKIEQTKDEAEAVDKMWEIEQKILNGYRKTSIKYKFFSSLEKYFRKAQNWARNKHKVPLEIRREAYEKSGRLAKDPDCLDLYGDL